MILIQVVRFRHFRYYIPLMTGYERIHAALEGRTQDMVPVTLHNFLMAAEEAGYTQEEYRNDPDKIANSFIKAVDHYNYDGVLLDIDTVTLAGAAGVPVDFPVGECARSNEGILNELSDIKHLARVDILSYKYVNIWLEAARKLADFFKGEISVRGNCDQAPFSLASMLRSPQEWMMDLYDTANEHLLFELLEYCCDITCRFIILMAETGVDIVSNGDSVAGPAMISPEMYVKFALPFEKRCIQTAHDLGQPYVLHICGNTDPILDVIGETGTDGIELDYLTDIHKIHDLYKDKLTLLGNIDPSGILTTGSPSDVRSTVQEVLEVYSDSPRFILNSGCAIPSTAPSINIQTMVETARGFSSSSTNK